MSAARNLGAVLAVSLVVDQFHAEVRPAAPDRVPRAMLIQLHRVESSPWPQDGLADQWSGMIEAALGMKASRILVPI